MTKHGKRACTSHRKGQVDQHGRAVPCGNPPSPGHWCCRKHGAASRGADGTIKRNLALAAYATEIDHLGRALEVSPTEAMLAMVHESAANVAALRNRIQELDPGFGPAGIAGSAGSTSKTNEAMRHIWVAMYDDERDRLVRYSKACRDAGVEEATVELAKAQGEQLASILLAGFTGWRAVIEALLPAELRPVLEVAWREVPTVVASAIEAGRGDAP